MLFRSPIGKTEPEAGVDIMVEEQLSVEVTLKFTTALQVFPSVFTEIFEGQLITGDWLSETVIVNEQAEEFPAASVATEFTVVVPIGKTEPEAGVDVTVAEQLSVELTVKFTTALQKPASTFAFMLPGQLMTGFSRSLTVTLKLHVAILPEGSVAVYVTVVIPLGNNSPGL